MSVIIKETTFLDCDNLPAEMTNAFDRPWNYVGDIRPQQNGWVKAMCQECRREDPNCLIKISATESVLPEVLQVVTLKDYLFITDDRIEVRVYFGTCEDCGAVYWARQGPPFARVRALASEKA